MNLVDILVPNAQFSTSSSADCAESAESQQRRGLQSPQLPAETCGFDVEAGRNPHNPQTPADCETCVTSGFPQNPHNPQALTPELSKPLPLTVEYFRAEGVELLAEDRAYLQWHLPKGTAQRNAYIQRYIGEWREAMEAEPLVHKKENAGRRAANTWLRMAAEGSDTRATLDKVSKGFSKKNRGDDHGRLG